MNSQDGIPARKQLERIKSRCDELFADLSFAVVRQWKSSRPGAKAIGFMPIYVPREIIHAAGMLPVGVVGGGDQIEIIRGDAYFQSYICHIPRSTIELGLSKRLDCLDGMIFPSICDVIRNLSGMWMMLFPEKYVKYLDVPQNFDPLVGGKFYRHELQQLKSDIETLGNVEISNDKLNASIAVFNENRRLISLLYQRRSERPWEVSTEEAYLLLRAGYLLPVEDHNEMLAAFLESAEAADRSEMDNARVVVTGAFCEQPPLGLIRTLERSGCYIVDDDFLLGSRWLLQPTPMTDDPIGALADAFLNDSTESASKYEPGKHKGRQLIGSVRQNRADGVIFCAPSFCDPALLEQPMLRKALDEAAINYTSFKYSEDTGQFGVIREQAGTFADTIKLWSD